MEESIKEEYCELYTEQTGNSVDVKNCENDPEFMEWLSDYLYS
jgi:hypothetical protein